MDKLIGTIIDEKYEVRRLIGRGGMGAVYEGFHLQLQIPVAIKILLAQSTATQESILRFRSEARFASMLKHQHIVTTMAFGMLDNVGPYIVMELLDGKSLAEELETTKTLPTGRFSKIFSQCCDALAHVHEQGYVHRDIKPSNIMLVRGADGTDFVKITDFGIAKLFGEQSMQALTRTGEILGTPLYMSPEQCLGNSIDQRSDIYSLGCVMYESLTGTPPFSAETALEVMMKQVDTAPELPGANGALASVVMHTLEKAPEKRPQSMTALLSELRDANQGIASFKARAKRKRLPKVLLCCAAGFLFAGLVAFFLPFRQPQNQVRSPVQQYYSEFEGQDVAENKSKYDAAINQAREQFAHDPRNTIYSQDMLAACRLQNALCSWMEGHESVPLVIEAYTKQVNLRYELNKHGLPSCRYPGISDVATKLAYLYGKDCKERWAALQVAFSRDDFREAATKPLCKLLLGDTYMDRAEFNNAESCYREAIQLTSQSKPDAATRLQLSQYELEGHEGLFRSLVAQDMVDDANAELASIIRSTDSARRGDLKTQWISRIEAAALNAKHGDVAKAQQLLRQAPEADFAQKQKDRMELVRAIRKYAEGRCAELTGNTQKATQQFAAARAKIDGLNLTDGWSDFWIGIIQTAGLKETIHKQSL